MSLSHRYPDFGTPPVDLADDPVQQADPASEAQLAVFEEGYQAGWDDAAQALERDQTRISSDLAQNFQDMSFTHHEALVKLTASMKPLMSQITGKFLPDIARQTLGMHILAQLSDLIDDQSTGAIEIAVAPSNLEALTAIMEDKLEVPFDLVAEPSLGDGQVYLRANQTEREINLDAVLSGVTDALDAFFHQNEKESQHG